MDPNTFGVDEDEFSDELDARDIESHANGQADPYAQLGALFRQMLDRLPTSFATMFDLDEHRRKMLTRTPKSAMATIVWMDVIAKSKDPDINLIDYLIETFDLRMIAMDGQGRNELREIMIAERMVSDEEEGEEIRTPMNL